MVILKRLGRKSRKNGASPSFSASVTSEMDPHALKLAASSSSYDNDFKAPFFLMICCCQLCFVYERATRLADTLLIVTYRPSKLK